MGSLGCPLCCQQDFESVGTLREHLNYYIYRPLQCGVCCLHLEGIHEFTHHLRCHLGDELPSSTKLSHLQPPVPAGKVCESQSSPLPLTTAAWDGAVSDFDVGIGTAHVSDEYSSYMKGSDAANQLLKLREWRLEKLGKNFSRHRASFGKSPGLLELSPVSIRQQRNSPPPSVRDCGSERRPCSQNSSYTPCSDILSVNKDIDSVERFDPFATPMSVYGNVGSVELCDDGVCPQILRGEQITEEMGVQSPIEPKQGISGIDRDSFQSNTNCTQIETNTETCLPLEKLATTTKTSGDELLTRNVHFQSIVPSESQKSYDDGLKNESRSIPCSSFALVSCSSQSSKDESKRNIDHGGCRKDFKEKLNKTYDDNPSNTEHYENNKSPMIVSSFEVNEDVSRQYLDLQPVPASSEERLLENSSRFSNIWDSCPNNISEVKPVEVSNKSHLKPSKDSCKFRDSHHTSIHSNFPNKNTDDTNLSSVGDGVTVLSENSGETSQTTSQEQNLNQDDALRGIRNQSCLPDADSCCPLYDNSTELEGGCEVSYSLDDTKPYLHKKFHHDQERKGLPNAGVDQVAADVSQYINSFQSVLVRKLNGTLSTDIPIASSVCTPSVIKSDEDLRQSVMEEPQQTKEHLCEVCQKTFPNSSEFQLHCKEHLKEPDNLSKGLYRDCSEGSSERRHPRKKKYQCDQCFKIFSKASNITRHVREVHAIKKSFTCAQCNKTFSSQRQLQDHSQIHDGKKVHKCSKCNHQCWTASGLRTHIQEIHSKNPEQRPHSCDICGEKFAKIYGLKRHKQRKHTEQELKCNVCSKTFTCKEDLNKHSKTHSLTNILKCDTCDKTFTTSWAFKRHVNTHQSSLNFKCKLCKANFTRKDSLVSHLNIHSQKRPFICHCGKSFVKKSQMKEHKIKHSNISRYTCSVCKSSFKFKASLKNHSCKKK